MRINVFTLGEKFIIIIIKNNYNKFRFFLRKGTNHIVQQYLALASSEGCNNIITLIFLCFCHASFLS